MVGAGTLNNDIIPLESTFRDARYTVIHDTGSSRWLLAAEKVMHCSNNMIGGGGLCDDLLGLDFCMSPLSQTPASMKDVGEKEDDSYDQSRSITPFLETSKNIFFTPRDSTGPHDSSLFDFNEVYPADGMMNYNQGDSYGNMMAKYFPPGSDTVQEVIHEEIDEILPENNPPDGYETLSFQKHIEDELRREKRRDPNYYESSDEVYEPVVRTKPSNREKLYYQRQKHRRAPQIPGLTTSKRRGRPPGSKKIEPVPAPAPKPKQNRRCQSGGGIRVKTKIVPSEIGALMAIEDCERLARCIDQLQRTNDPNKDEYKSSINEDQIQEIRSKVLECSHIEVQDGRGENDLYTPHFMRGTASEREGLCLLCDPPVWLRTKQSSYWYHMNYFHGISSVTGLPYAYPKQYREIILDFEDDTRRLKDDHVSKEIPKSVIKLEGMCHNCNHWIPISQKECFTSQTESSSPSLFSHFSWFKHAQKCH